MRQENDMGRKKVSSGIAAFALLLLSAGCEECDVGTAWCEDNTVMVCVSENDGATEEDDWDDTSEEEDNTWLDLIIAIFEIADTADGNSRIEVFQACGDMDQVCMEKEYGPSGDVEVVCEPYYGTY
jgi:hypothetical protein